MESSASTLNWSIDARHVARPGAAKSGARTTASATAANAIVAADIKPQKPFEGRLMGLFSRMIQNSADRVAFALGSHSAGGRLNLSAATAEVRKQWTYYATRKAIRAPTIRHLSNFLGFQYGVSWEEELIEVTGAEPGEILDMSVVLPRVADMLLDSGQIVIERGA